MVYYYICQDCGSVKEFTFQPDQDFIYCDNPVHDDTPFAMELVVPYAKNAIQTDELTEESHTLKELLNVFGMIFILLISMGITGVVFIGIIKFWIWFW